MGMEEREAGWKALLWITKWLKVRLTEMTAVGAERGTGHVERSAVQTASLLLSPLSQRGGVT